jgi:transposase-like protein
MVEARSPYVIVTDKDDQIKGALLDVFPDAQQQICRFHINKNVHLKAKTKGKWPRRQAGDDPEGLLDV